MIEFVPFRAGHLKYLKPQPAQAGEHAALVRSGEAAALEGGTSLSAWAGSTCLGASGLLHVRPHRAVAWLILSDGAGPYMLPIVRKIRRVIALSQYQRVELTVAADFEAGRRFAESIGAVCETPEPMRFFGADGRDERMYAVVKGN